MNDFQDQGDQEPAPIFPPLTPPEAEDWPPLASPEELPPVEQPVDLPQADTAAPAAEQQMESSREAPELPPAEANRLCGYPPLIGTTRQVAWAETIREYALRQNGNNLWVIIEQIPSMGSPHAAALITVAHAGRRALETERLARWWIDNRLIVNSYCHDLVVRLNCLLSRPI